MGAISCSCKETEIITTQLQTERNLKIQKEEEKESPIITDKEEQKIQVEKKSQGPKNTNFEEKQEGKQTQYSTFLKLNFNHFICLKTALSGILHKKVVQKLFLQHFHFKTSTSLSFYYNDDCKLTLEREKEIKSYKNVKNISLDLILEQENKLTAQSIAFLDILKSNPRILNLNLKIGGDLSILEPFYEFEREKGVDYYIENEESFRRIGEGFKYLKELNKLEITLPSVIFQKSYFYIKYLAKGLSFLRNIKYLDLDVLMDEYHYQMSSVCYEYFPVMFKNLGQLKYLFLFLYGNNIGKDPKNMQFIAEGLSYLSSVQILLLNIEGNNLGQNQCNTRKLAEGIQKMKGLRVLYLHVQYNFLQEYPEEFHFLLCVIEGLPELKELKFRYGEKTRKICQEFCIQQNITKEEYWERQLSNYMKNYDFIGEKLLQMKVLKNLDLGYEMIDVKQLQQYSNLQFLVGDGFQFTSQLKRLNLKLMKVMNDPDSITRLPKAMKNFGNLTVFILDLRFKNDNIGENKAIFKYFGKAIMELVSLKTLILKFSSNFLQDNFLNVNIFYDLLERVSGLQDLELLRIHVGFGDLKRKKKTLIQNYIKGIEEKNGKLHIEFR